MEATGWGVQERFGQKLLLCLRCRILWLTAIAIIIIEFSIAEWIENKRCGRTGVERDVFGQGEAT